MLEDPPNDTSIFHPCTMWSIISTSQSTWPACVATSDNTQYSSARISCYSPPLSPWATSGGPVIAVTSPAGTLAAAPSHRPRRKLSTIRFDNTHLGKDIGKHDIIGIDLVAMSVNG